MGTAELAGPILLALHEQPDFDVSAVVTQPDRPRGRHLEVQPSAVKQIALQTGLQVLQPDRARNPEFIDAIRQLAPDLVVVVAYGQILPQALLDVPRLGCLNVHTSLLPKYRGAAPIQWAILEGETETGVTIMKMDAGMDTGPILTQTREAIMPEDDSQTLHNRLAELAAELIAPTIHDYISGKVQPVPQPEGASYARKISKEDGRIDWSQPAQQICNRVRAFTPWPGAFTLHGEQPKQRLLKIWRAQVEPNQSAHPGVFVHCDKSGIVVGTGKDALRITELQREGGRRVTAQEFLAGHPLHPGDHFGS